MFISCVMKQITYKHKSIKVCYSESKFLQMFFKLIEILGGKSKTFEMFWKKLNVKRMSFMKF